MSSSYVEQFQVLEARPRLSGSRIGAIVAIEPGPIVDFPGNPLGPQRARVAASLTAETMSAACSANLPVLLVFENDDPSRPVIIDVIVERPPALRLRGRPFRKKSSDREDADATPRTERDGLATALARILCIDDGVVMVEDIAEPRPAPRGKNGDHAAESERSGRRVAVLSTDQRSSWGRCIRVFRWSRPAPMAPKSCSGEVE